MKDPGGVLSYFGDVSFRHARRRICRFFFTQGVHMAGVKGRSGGARPGSGPKPRVVKGPAAPGADALAYLHAVVADESADPRLRLDAAKALLPYVLKKPGTVGKKQQAQEAAEAIIRANPDLAARPPPPGKPMN